MTHRIVVHLFTPLILLAASGCTETVDKAVDSVATQPSSLDATDCPIAALTPETLDFQYDTLGGYASLELTISNACPEGDDLIVDPVESSFVPIFVAGNYEAGIPPGGSLAFTVGYIPYDRLSHEFMLYVHTNDAASPAEVPVRINL